MPTMKQQGQLDGDFFRGAEREVSMVFEEPVTIKRWVSQAGGNAPLGVAPTTTWRNIATRANVSMLTAEELALPNSIFVAGDISIELRLQVFGGAMSTGPDGQTAGAKGDRVLWRGREYYLVGHVDRLQLNGRPYYVGKGKPTGS